MSHKSKYDLFQQAKDRLKSMERFGESKHQAKINGTMKEGIFSYDTAKAYARETNRFINWLRDERGVNTGKTTLDEVRPLAKEYIQEHNADERWSPSSVKLQASALAKLYQTESKEFGETAPRNRSGITRSRCRTVISDKTGKEIKNQSTRAGHFSEKNHKDIVSFEKVTGLRRAELTNLTNRDGAIYHENGRTYLRVQEDTKGGRVRSAELCGSEEEKQAVIDKINSVPEGHKVWGKVPAAMDVHYYRGVHAKNLYDLAYKEKYGDLDPKMIPGEDKYICRGDRAGEVLSRSCMERVTESLGHSRISVIAGHYLY